MSSGLHGGHGAGVTPRRKEEEAQPAIGRYLHPGGPLPRYKGISESDRDKLGTIYWGYLEGLNLTWVEELQLSGNWSCCDRPYLQARCPEISV